MEGKSSDNLNVSNSLNSSENSSEFLKSSKFKSTFMAIFLALIVLASTPAAFAQDAPGGLPYIPDIRQIVPAAKDGQGVSSALQILILLTVLSLAPAILMMVTSFTRIIVVLALLRQALATQQLPPNQVLVGLALFMTFMVMAPTWTRVQSEAVTPFLNDEIDQSQAFSRAVVPIRDFMIRQIEQSGNEKDVFLFLDRTGHNAQQWGEVPTTVLVPSFITSELKTAFIIGFKIYLPFLVIDMVVASVIISMGMLMLPPMLISMPFKLLLFVLVDGWHLVIGSLIYSFV